MPESTATRNRKKLIDQVEHRRRQLISDVEEIEKIKHMWGADGRLGTDGLASLYEKCHLTSSETDDTYSDLRSVEVEQESFLGEIGQAIASAERQIRNLGKLADALARVK